MATADELQAFVDQLTELCHKHGLRIREREGDGLTVVAFPQEELVSSGLTWDEDNHRYGVSHGATR